MTQEDKCVVHIPDPSQEQIMQMAAFIIESGLTCYGIKDTDVSDFSLTTDMLYTYNFATPEDAAWFVLKWK